MNVQSVNDLRDFHEFVGERLNNGGASLSPEEVLGEWRVLHPDPETAESDIAAIQEAIDDVKRGDRGIPFADFDREYRERRCPPSS